MTARRGIPASLRSAGFTVIFYSPMFLAIIRAYVVPRDARPWLARGKTTSPKTNAELPHAFLVPNRHLKAMCQQFLDEVREVEEAGG